MPTPRPSSAKPRLPARRSALVEILEARIAPAAVFWNGGGDGTSWTSADNWSNKLVPTSMDDVTLNPAGTITVTLAGAQAVHSLVMVGDDTLSLFNSSLTLGAASEIKHLALTGSSTVSTAGDLTLSGTASLATSSALAGPGKIFNTGTLDLGGGSSIQTELQDTGSATISNGTFSVSGAGAKLRVLGGGVLQLTNATLQRPNGGLGVFIESGGSLTAIGSDTTGNGLVVDGGVVNVVNDPTFGGNLQLSGATLHDATFHVAGGAVVAFNGSSQQNAVSGTIIGTGPGQVVINGTNAFVLAADTVFNFAPGVLQFQNAASIDGPGTLTNVGDLHGSPVLKTKVLSTGTFTPTSTVTFSGASAELRILAGGTFDSTGVSLAGDATSKGLFVESGGVLSGNFSSGTIPVQVLGGTVRTAGGTEQFFGAASLVGAQFDTTGGGQIFFQNASTTKLSGTITGAGPAATVTFGNASAVSVAEGGATLDFAPGMAVFNDATINGPGVLTSVGELRFGANILSLKTELRIENTLNFAVNNLIIDGVGAMLHIAAGGQLQAGTGGISAANGGVGVVVDHGGLVQVTGALIVTAPFDNQGEVLVDNLLRLNGPIAQISGTAGQITLTGGTWIQHGNSFLDFNGTSINTIGAGADVTVGSGNFRFPPITGLTDNAGTLRLIEGQNLPLNSQLTNSGTIVLGPGSELMVGAFMQTAAGVTEFQISGAGAGQQGELAAISTALLGGTARVSILGGFAPAQGQSFPLMTFAAHEGQFARVEGLSLGHANVFETVYTPTTLSLNSLVSAADLAVQTITLPGAGTAGQDVSFSYAVKNVGSVVTPAGNWTDTVYLSKDGTLDASDSVLARVAHSGVLAAGASYTANVTVPLVGALPDSYRLIVVADSQGFVADTDRTNNTLASTGVIALDITALTPGATFNGNIANGHDQYYKVTLPAGQTPTFTFTGAVAGVAEIYESLGVVPTTASFDAATFNPGGTAERLAGQATAAATYYILLHGREAAGAGQNFSLLAGGSGFDLAGTSVAHGANIGNVTTTLTGSQFSPTTTFTLVPASGPSKQATAVSYHDSQSADATFDLTGLAAGSYSIVASNGGPTDTLASAFTVTNGGNPGTLSYSLSAPSAVRPPFVGVAATITYENVGDTDLAAPLFELVAENARLRLADEPGFVAGTFTQASGRSLGVFELLGVSGGLAGVLSPGEKATIDVIFEPIDATAHAKVNFNLLVAGNSSAPINFDALKADVKPIGVADDAWDAVFTNFKAAAGTTIGSYKAMLVDNANYLGQFGKVSPAATRLVDFELDQAGVLGAIVDRYELGAFGRGQASPFGESLTVSAAGDVTVQDGHLVREFIKSDDGSYHGTGVDFGVLTRSTAGVFTLDEGTGTHTVFRPSDGHIDFVQDANGHRITGAWNSHGQLVSVTDSATGSATHYTYNAHGRVATETDPVGRVTTYGYDAGGEHLTSVANALGTTTYTYVTGQGAASEHAVASVTGPDGVTTTFTYDAQGRLTQRSIGTGAEAVTVSYAYDSAGKITQTDAVGHVTQTFYIAQGALARSIDPLGQVTAVAYDTLGRFLSVTDPSGTKTSASLDSAGLLHGAVDASRSQTQFQLGGDIRRLQSVTDPLGDATKFNYDAKGNLLETLFPDGFASTYEYDSAGRIIAATDANGARTTLTYNAAGLLSLRTHADGSTEAFTFDAHRNLLTATDAAGTTTLSYDSADRLTSITYPNGKTVTSTYDSAGRRATVADQTGFTVRYSYDALGRLDQVHDTAGALLVQYQYNSLGQTTTETRGNGATTDYTYDAADRVATITHRDAAHAVTDFFNYTYDAQDRVASVTDVSGTTTYTYDLTGQLIGAALPGGRTISYHYDAEGNRVSVADSASGTDNYTTNHADQYATAGAETLSYDHAGRVVASTVGGVTTSYRYDASGRLIGLTSPGSVITYEFDALGNRIGRTENGVRTDFAYDPSGLGTVFGEYQGASTTAHYATGLGVAARADSSGAESYYHYDAGGNTALLSGAGGSSIASYTYLPFGKVASHTGSVTQPFTFNGGLGVQDDSGGQFYMRARNYDAGLGRFTSRDPIGFSGGDTNLYRFGNNDPLNHTDPSGLDAYYSTVQRFFSADYYDSIETAFTFAYGRSADAIRAGNTAVGAYTEIIPTTFKSASTALEVGYPSLINPAAVKVIGKGAQALNFLKPVAEFLGPVAKIAGSVPVQVAIAAINVAEIESAAYNYYHDAGTYGKFTPDEKNFSPQYYKKNGDNWLLNELIKNAPPGKTKQEATLDAIAFLKKLNNDFIRDQQNMGGGAAGAAARVTAATIDIFRPHDPNNLVGPAGAGADPVPDPIAPGQTRFDGFVGAGASFPYKIEFENQPTAGVPAQVVQVTQTLDAHLDLATFAFTGFGFGASRVDVPAGANGTSFHTVYDATATLGVKVQIDATLDTQTRALKVTYTSLDPSTNDVPLDPFSGFLPPENGAGAGDGFLTYSVQPKAGLLNATSFTAGASIVFDTEAAIATPTVHNTLDTVGPTSQLSALPAATARTTFAVHWTGADNAGGSGLAGITLSYTDNDGPLQTAIGVSAANGYQFTGAAGHTYKFFSQAVDNVGNTEPLAATPGAVVSVVVPVHAVTIDARNPLSYTDANGDLVTVRLTGLGSAVADLVGDANPATTHADLDTLVLANTTAKSALSVTVRKPPAAGDGLTTIGEVTGGTLGSFSAPQADLVVEGLVLTGTVGTVAIHDLIPSDPSFASTAIQVGGLAKNLLTVTAHHLADGFAFSTTSTVKLLRAADIGEGSIRAAGLTSLVTTTGALNADLVIAGTVGAIAAKTSVDAGAWSAASFGSVSAGLGDFAANLTTAGKLGLLKVTKGSLTGNLTAGALGTISVAGGGASGTWTAAGIGAVSVTRGALSATVTATGALTSVHVSGGDLSGNLTAQRFGAVSVTGGNFTSTLTSTSSRIALGRLAALTSLTVTTGQLTGNLSLLGAAGPIVEKGAAATGTWSAGSFGAITVTGAPLAATVSTAGAIGAVTVTGGGLTGALTAQKFGAITVTGGDLSGVLTSLATPAVLKNIAALASLKVTGGNLTGDVRLDGALGSLTVLQDAHKNGGSILGAEINAAKIAAITVAKDLTNAQIWAGADLGSDHALGGAFAAQDHFAAGSIGAIKISGAATGALIAAGLQSTDTILKNGDDTLLSGTIASLTITGTASPDSYFAATKFTAGPHIAGKPVTPATDARFKSA